VFYKEKIKSRIVKLNTKIVDALKKMDEVNVKLLLIVEGTQFNGLLTIGDIQRAILRNVDLNEKINKIVRKDFVLAFDDEDIDVVKRKMLIGRDECMPIVDRHNNLVDLLIWEEIFENEMRQVPLKVQLPIVIMAGGRGTRLKPLTNIIPKAMIPLGENSIIEKIIRGFEGVGATEFFITSNYKHELLDEHLRDVNLLDKVKVINELTEMGTVVCLSLLRDYLPQECVLTNCDIIIKEDYSTILDFHIENHNDVTIVAAINTKEIPYGILQISDNGELKSIDEKPKLSYLINSGMYVLGNSALNLIPVNTRFDTTDLILSAKRHNLKVGVFPISENDWLDIGEWTNYKSILLEAIKL